jgi:hypothetical protein
MGGERQPNTPGRIRTCDHRFRKAMLYPLSYEGAREGAIVGGVTAAPPDKARSLHYCR